MVTDPQQIIGIIVLSPLLAAIIAGLFGKQIGRNGAHSITIFGVALSLGFAILLASRVCGGEHSALNFNAYTWSVSGNIEFYIGFLLDPLSTTMMVIVNFVSLLVHIYTIGYMHDDPGYQRFFSYISLFTFSMLMLVSANNCLQLFFGWEGVGLVSYLLIGFWFEKESANQGSIKAFIANRVGDFGFLLGIAAIYQYFGTLDYATIFEHLDVIRDQAVMVTAHISWSVPTMIAVLLFIGAMGKSAQVPLHIWLPESMEGPTPISALIHAATMVTAGIFMVSRMSPIYELSPSALSLVLVIGATGALFMGLLGIVQNDIKRVVAYSTLSQLGYMMTALGVSAYSVGMFHLMTHACFKALLFLAAGSVIIGMHHEQDMRKMGGLWRYMPITYCTYLIGSLALCGIPPFAGFYSKDMIIEAVRASERVGSTYAAYCVTIGAFVTALYTFRSLFMTFHGRPRMDEHTRHHLKESPWVVTVPLILLAIPSTIMGFFMIDPMLFEDGGLLKSSLVALPPGNVLSELSKEFTGPIAMVFHAPVSMVFWLVMGGVLVAFVAYRLIPIIPGIFARGCGPFYEILLHKYGFDAFNDVVFIRGTRRLAHLLWQIADVKMIDTGLVNNSGRLVQACARTLRGVQTGFLHHYAFVMLLGLVSFLFWQVLK